MLFRSGGARGRACPRPPGAEQRGTSYRGTLHVSCVQCSWWFLSLHFFYTYLFCTFYSVVFKDSFKHEEFKPELIVDFYDAVTHVVLYVLANYNIDEALMNDIIFSVTSYLTVGLYVNTTNSFSLSQVCIDALSLHGVYIHNFINSDKKYNTISRFIENPLGITEQFVVSDHTSESITVTDEPSDQTTPDQSSIHSESDSVLPDTPVETPDIIYSPLDSIIDLTTPGTPKTPAYIQLGNSPGVYSHGQILSGIFSVNFQPPCDPVMDLDQLLPSPDELNDDHERAASILVAMKTPFME